MDHNVINSMIRKIVILMHKAVDLVEILLFCENTLDLVKISSQPQLLTVATIYSFPTYEKSNTSNTKKKNTSKCHQTNWKTLRLICDCVPCSFPHLQDLHEGEQAVLQRPLVFTVEHQRLQQLQDGQHVAEERQVVLAPELLEVEVDASVEKRSDHRQVSGKFRKVSCDHSPDVPPYYSKGENKNIHRVIINHVSEGSYGATIYHKRCIEFICPTLSF